MGSKFIDITGQAFNELTALECIDHKNRIWKWRCSCGKICTARKNDVTSGRKKSCGHLSNHGNASIQPGDKFGEWTVMDEDENWDRHYICKCSCGNIRSIHSYDLRKGNSKSCGHLTKGTAKNGRKDLTGQQIGEWTIGEYIGGGKYICTCSCGTIKELSGTYLRTGQSKSCGHNTNAFKDLTGQQIGDWTVLRYLGKYIWECKCSCGNIKNVASYDLTHGNSLSCGHDKRDYHLEGKKFNKLTAIEYIGHNKYKCKCDCGNTTIVAGHALLTWQTKSCRCLANDKRNENINKIVNAIKLYKETNGDDPFPEDIADITDLHPVTIRHYAENHNIIGLNTHFGSKAERDIYNICKSYGYKIISRDKKELSGEELDIYIPEKHIAIEYNGDYWHSTYKKDINYHKNKSLNALRNKIRIIHIFEHEWINHKDSVTKLIDSALSMDNGIANIREIRNYTNKKVIGYYSNNKLEAAVEINIDNSICTITDMLYINKYRLKHIVGYIVNKYNISHIIAYIDISKYYIDDFISIGFNIVDEYEIIPDYKLVRFSDFSTIQDNDNKYKLLDSIRKEGLMQIYDCGKCKVDYSIINNT